LGRIWHNPEKNPVFGLSKPIPVSVAIFRGNPRQIPELTGYSKQDGWPVEGQSTTGKDGYWPYQGWEKDPEEVIHH
jgi:hypothetical protein